MKPKFNPPGLGFEVSF